MKKKNEQSVKKVEVQEALAGVIGRREEAHPVDATAEGS